MHSTAGAESRVRSGRAHRRGRVLYLTFDDGPDRQWTPLVLAVLARNRAMATFFEVGSQIRRNPAAAAQVRAAGHRVGNHSASHAHLIRLAGPVLRREVAGGVPMAHCLRPPYGEVDRAVRAAAARVGQRVVLWTVDTRDWSRPGAARVRHALLAGAAPGAVLLLHDGGGDRSETVTALADALPVLAARGYRFESIPGC